jgi:superfamily II DNA or RNA helicase
VTDLQNDRAARASSAEDLFVELFSQVFGFEKTQLLAPEYPVRDLLGNSRFIDFALKTAQRKIAFEVDGPSHYGGFDYSVFTYENDLLRQNSLIHDGWQVFRWTDRQLVKEPVSVKEQLTLFLARVPGLLELDDFLPKQAAASSTIDLRTHQQAALDWLACIRSEGKTIALLEHATGSGKTVTAISDARRVGPRVLYVAHRKNLVQQTFREFRRLWPEVSHGRVLGSVSEADREVVCASIQSLGKCLADFPADAFRYLIIDKAHHAAAESYRTLLGHLAPAFTLGLTATPERPDGKPILEMFRDMAHRLPLKEAIRRGELVPIRCVRVKSNVDLSRVRFNEVQYNRRDLEQSVMVPARDQLIVETYLDHVRGRKGVTFCVNVRHGEQLAALFREHGVEAQSVSGTMRSDERDDVLLKYSRGEVRMLCACDILNEGWDCPDVEVLLMARPTLSKIVYMQQLGRGTRKAPGKEALIVFDFVDNPGRYNAGLSLHRLTKTKRYHKGALVLGPDDRIAEEQTLFELGQKPEVILNLGLWAEDYEEIDLFDWQSVAKDMLTLTQMEAKLAVAEGFLRRKIQAGELVPDHTLEIGNRTHYYFRRDSEDAIRQQCQIEAVTAQNIRELFFRFCDEMDMTASYKPVLLLCLLDTVNERGRVSIAALTQAFRNFYERRQAAGLRVEKANMRMACVTDLDSTDIQQIILKMPFRKFSQRGYLDYGRDVSQIRFDPMLWRRLSGEDRERLREIAQTNIDRYFERANV